MGGSVNLNEVIDKSRADATQLFFIYALLVVATGIFLNLIIYLAKRDGFREGLKKALDHSSSSKVSWLILSKVKMPNMVPIIVNGIPKKEPKGTCDKNVIIPTKSRTRLKVRET